MKILVPVDGSPHSLAMIERFLDRRAWFAGDVAITLLYVHPELPYKRAAAWAGHDAVREYYEEETTTALAGAREVLDAKRVAYTVDKRVGDPAAEIAKAAQQEGFDLIAMGTHGHTGFANLVMGSVATKVVAQSPVPVLLFGEKR